MKRFWESVALLFVGAVFGAIFQKQCLTLFYWLTLYVVYYIYCIIWPFICFFDG